MFGLFFLSNVIVVLFSINSNNPFFTPININFYIKFTISANFPLPFYKSSFFTKNSLRYFVYKYIFQKHIGLSKKTCNNNCQNH
ncbi:hypothetical protein CW304_15120 [Bacillus sp. UFRGS-B20]|nr:hypothetical protein CW304_15120 [Bacillus sp. UFRGS-B20]